MSRDADDRDFQREEVGPYFQGSRLMGVEDDQESGWLTLKFDNGYEWLIPVTDDGFVVVHSRAH